jgi:hypothetical protein
MLSQPGVAVAEIFRRLRLLDAARVNFLRGAGGGRLHEQERSNIHGHPFSFFSIVSAN